MVHSDVVGFICSITPLNQQDETYVSEYTSHKSGVKVRVVYVFFN